LRSNRISDLTPLSGLVDLGDWPPAFCRPVWEGVEVPLDLAYNQIADISALVLNEGLSEGDGINLSGNPLSPDSIDLYIPQLEERGVNVVP